MKLVIEEGRWATRNNEMIFGNVVWLTEEQDAYLYHLIDENNETIKLEHPITHYIVRED